MKPSTILAYLFGRREAILEVAANRAALWTGIVLVLLTSIARNYDQTHITEKPLLWLFGSLAFSIMSGTWVFLVVCAVFATKEPEGAANGQTSFLERWRQFMALFWLTAPIAWLYAIPVERFFDSLTAAKANVALLAIVSFWRVFLMARVVAVMLNVHHFKSLAAVLFAASLEVFVVSLSGGTFARSIAAGMGGMRNSPEEEVLIGTMGFAFLNSLWIGAVSLVAVLFIALQRDGKPAWGRPDPNGSPTSFRWLWVIAFSWVVLAVYPQVQLSRNLQLEELVQKGEYRKALDFLNSHRREDFAPSRQLPPKAYEMSVFGEMTRFMEGLEANDEDWVRQHLMLRYREMCSHLGHENPHKPYGFVLLPDQQASQWMGELTRNHGDITAILEGLGRIPEGKAWIACHLGFLEALRWAVENPDMAYVPEADQPRLRERLSNVRDQLGSMGIKLKPPEERIVR